MEGEKGTRGWGVIKLKNLLQADWIVQAKITLIFFLTLCHFASIFDVYEISILSMIDTVVAAKHRVIRNHQYFFAVLPHTKFILF